MPADFPSSVVLRCPVDRTLAMPSRVIEFLDGSEQRWAAGDPLNSFALQFDDLVASELSTIVNWVDTVKGAFDSTWSLVGPDGVTYPFLGLEDDLLSAVESGKAERYSLSLRMRQVAPDGDYSATAPAVYPAL